MRDGAVVHEALLGPALNGRPAHAASLLAEVERAADALGGWSDVDLIAVGLGPGSFTGLRIGIATARALSAGAGVPAVGVCTLDALGRELARSAGESGSLAVIDARRGEVFAALYEAGGDRAWEPFVAAPEDLVARLGELPEPPRAAGSGALRFRDELAGCGVEVPAADDPAHRVAARHLCALAESLEDGGRGPLAPIYLRPPDAERWRERDTSDRAE